MLTVLRLVPHLLPPIHILAGLCGQNPGSWPWKQPWFLFWSPAPLFTATAEGWGRGRRLSRERSPCYPLPSTSKLTSTALSHPCVRGGCLPSAHREGCTSRCGRRLNNGPLGTPHGLVPPRPCGPSVPITVCSRAWQHCLLPSSVLCGLMGFGPPRPEVLQALRDSSKTPATDPFLPSLDTQ